MPNTMRLVFSLIFLESLAVSIVNAQTFEAIAYRHEHVAGVQQFGYLNGLTASSMLYYWAATIDPSGNIYLAGANRVRVITPAGRVWNLAGTGVQGYKDGPAESAMFNMGGSGYDGAAIAIDSSGNLYALDGSNQKIRKIYRDNGQWKVTTFAGKLTANTMLDVNTQTCNLADFKPAGQLSCVTVDSNANVWTHDVRGFYRISPPVGSGDWTVHWYAKNPWMVSDAGVIALAPDGSGNVYALGRYNQMVYYKLSPPDYTVKHYAGRLGPSNDSIDGPAIDLNTPSTATVFGTHATCSATADGTVYGGGGDEHWVRRIKNGYSMTLQPDGWHYYNTPGLVRNAWFLGAPIYVDTKGVIYLLQTNDPRMLALRKLVPPN